MNEKTVSENAIVIERTFNAPITLVWQMWTDSDHVKQWYGPQGFTVPVVDMQVEVGGRRFVGMLSPDGKMKMWTVGEFTAVDPTTRLAYTESMADEHGNAMSPADLGMGDYPETTEVTITLETVDSGTKMVMTHAGVPADSPGASGWAQALDKLATHISEIHNA